MINRSKFNRVLSDYFGPKSIRVVPSAVFISVLSWMMLSSTQVVTTEAPIAGVYLESFARNFPFALAGFLSAGSVLWLFKSFQKRRPAWGWLFYVANLAVALLALAVRQSLGELLQLSPPAWSLLPNQIAFAFVVFSISFFLQQVIGVSTKRLREENGRANSALAELENQQQLLIKYQEHSRKELATYLHDGLQSNLVVLGLQMQQASNALPKKYQGIGNSFIDEIERMRRTDVRSAIRQLSPELEGLSLRPALQELFKRYTKAVEIELELDDAAQEPKVPTGLKLAAYRIVEQALINAVVHAQPAKIEVSLSLSENEMTVQVTNDGKAQGEEIAPGTGFAIVGAWCKAFDGSFHLSVENGQTALTATLSLPGAGTN